MTEEVSIVYGSTIRVFNPNTNKWDITMPTTNEVTGQEIDITQIPVEKLQLRNGWKVEVVLSQGAICYVVFRDNKGSIDSGYRTKEGKMYHELDDELDVILKGKQKVKLAPFYYQQKKSNTIRTSMFIDTEEGSRKWCSEMHCELIKWLGDTPLAIKMDAE